MKISKLNKLAGTLFVLALGTTTLFAQGWGNRNRVLNPEKSNMCVTQISDLSDQQKKEMTKSLGEHQVTMTELRDKMHAEIDPVGKSKIRTEMLESILSHRNSIKEILNSEQQRQFDLLNLKKQFAITGNFGMNNCQGNRQGCRNNFNRGNQFCKGNYGATQRGRFRQGSCNSL